MSEDIENAIADAIEKATSAAEGANQFFFEQAPLIADQILAWGMIKAGSGVLVLWGLTALLFYVIYRREDIVKDEEGQAALTITGGLTGISTFFLGFIPLSFLIKIWLAPKLYLLEYVRAMV